MSDIIKLLPDSVANQIAAGEVIQRPASVVKELVENAVDAGADSIRIILKDAGRTLIQVIDNGCGMSETDARMAFERHATSKIKNATDLYSLHTMGFRGEALPSIAAVAQIDLRTMPKGASLGTRLIINGSKVESQEPEACSPGTNLMVKNLFFNIPVRRKFLKKDSVELSNVLREFERLALVNPNVEFTVIHNDVTLHRLLPAPFKQRIVDLFGKNMERQLIPVTTDTSMVRINGYIGLPENAKRRGALQYLMVNGRNMRHPYFHKGILQCYEQLIPADSQPSYFINFTVDPDTIDVNIHPTKNEIKFENEQPIWQILNAAVRESLSRYNAVPAIDFNRDDAPEIPPFSPDASARPDISYNPSFNPFDKSSGSHASTSFNPPHRDTARVPMDWQKLYEDFNSSSPASSTVRHDTPPSPSDATLGFDIPAAESAALQLKNKYLIVPSRDGMKIIDQHRAHTLVLFEKYLKSLSEGKMESQQVMFADPVELSPSQSAILEGMMDELREAGYSLSRSEGSDTWIIEAVPAPVASLNPATPLLAIIDTAADTGDDPLSSIHRRVALTMARSAAVRYDQPLSAAEREQLTASLLSLPNPGLTPDGLPTMTVITLEEISRRLS